MPWGGVVGGVWVLVGGMSGGEVAGGGPGGSDGVGRGGRAGC